METSAAYVNIARITELDESIEDVHGELNMEPSVESPVYKNTTADLNSMVADLASISEMNDSLGQTGRSVTQNTLILEEAPDSTDDMDADEIEPKDELSKKPAPVRQMTMKSLLVEESFKKGLLKSCMHGLPQWVESRRFLNRCFWLGLVVLMCFAGSQHTIVVVKKAFDNPMVTKVTYHQLNNVHHPPITICMENGYMLDPQRIINADGLEFAEQILYAAPFFGRGLRNVTRESLDPTPWHPRLPGYMKKTNLSAPAAIRHFMTQYAYPCQEFLRECRNPNRQKVDCCRIFVPVFNLKHGICYTLNRTALPTVNITGRFSTLYVDISRSLSGHIDMSHNVVLYVGSDGTEQGASSSFRNVLSPNMSYNVRVRLQRFTVDDEKICERNPKLAYFLDYTFDNCMWEKRFFNNSKLGLPCVPPVLMLTNPAFNHTNKPFCDADQIHHRLMPRHDRTAKQLMAKLQMGGQTATPPCKGTCDTWVYQPHIEAFVISREKPNMQLFVGYDEAMYSHSYAVPALDWQDYLCLFGGLLGLWLGSSVITLFYLAIFLVQRFLAPFLKGYYYLFYEQNCVRKQPVSD